nr:TIGR01777 family protein [Candidatus Dadabacteria bacterium]NIQ15068.1 TIGR01777 family protein [Candidatus Dadabacteria bacterium]
GENIVGRWTENKKQIIRDSRVESTKILVKRFSELKKPPKCFICASAIGYYGNKGSEELDENSGPDTGFLPEICIDWEKEANKSNDLGIRVVNLRIGVVLSSNGGALGKMLTPFKLGLGGMVGDGKQYWSWVSIDDMSRIIKFAAENNNISGPLNAVSPNPVTNKEFTTILASVLKRPAILNVPSFFIKLIFGEMGKHGILSSTRVLPKKLLDNGYNFQHSNLKLALIDILKK